MSLDDWIEDIIFDDSDDDWIKDFLFDDSEERQLQLILELYGQSSSSKSRKRIDRNREAGHKRLVNDTLNSVIARRLSLMEDFKKVKEREIAVMERELAVMEKKLGAKEKELAAKEKEVAAKERDIDMQILYADTSIMTEEQLSIHAKLLEKTKAK